jgi:hypothetical protein
VFNKGSRNSQCFKGPGRFIYRFPAEFSPTLLISGRGDITFVPSLPESTKSSLMFIGHFAVGFGTKKSTHVSLGLLFIAVQFLDLLWPNFLLLGVEHVSINQDPAYPIPLIFTDYPWSHSLIMALAWSIAFGGTYWLFRRNKRQALILGLCVFSHWILDLLVHVPDLPLFPGASAKVGLGLWRYPVASNLLEIVFFIGGLALYARSTRPKTKSGTVSLWLLVVLLLASAVANLVAPAPPSVNAIAWGAQAMWLFILLAFYTDAKRVWKVKAIDRKKKAMGASLA